MVTIDCDLNTRSLRDVLVPVDCMLASRFHAMISALSMEIPVMVLGWGHKYKEVLAQFRIEDWCFDFSNLNATTLLRDMDAFLEACPEIKDRISHNLPEVRSLSLAQFEWLNGFLRPQLDAYGDEDVV